MSSPWSDPIDVTVAASLLRTLANPSRLRVALRLLESEQSVAELEKGLGLRQPNLSQQLAELRDAGLVATRREAKSIFYRLAGEPQRRLIAMLRQGFGGSALVADDAYAPAPRPRFSEVARFAVVQDPPPRETAGDSW